MLKNENIICISSIDWDFIWQGHQEIMSTLAKNGNRVLFVENTGVRPPELKDIKRIKNRIKNRFRGVKGIRKIRDNLFVYSPLVLPLPYSRVAVWLNSCYILSILEKWKKAANFNNPLIFTFLPTPLSLSLINSIVNKGIVYYCIDDFAASSASARKIRDSEIRLLKIADLVLTTSSQLYNFCVSYNRNTHIFPFGVDYEKFETARQSSELQPEEIKNIRHPIAGYIGGIHKWMDISLIKKLAANHPDYSFVFIGPVQTDVSVLLNMRNIHFLGQQGHEKLPFFIKSFDACLIPYLITAYTKNVYPTKLNEYLAMGKPVISTSLPEVINFNKTNKNIVFIANGHDEFISSLDRAISIPDAAVARERIEAAKKNSWKNRISEISALMQDVIREKERSSFDWYGNFVKLFKKLRRKTVKAAFLSASAYLLVFYTPLVWILGRPLLISQGPEKAGAIVVFAGGVGESGKAGQGYEERVHRAVELYNEGYAPKIIFSSGYKYFFEEVFVMKSLAVSLGVPEKAIILEDKAIDTYGNVMFTKKILSAENIDTILLISSPYHMRRASFVFTKIAKNIKVTYAPAAESLFYAHPAKDANGKRIWKRINLRQIQGIIHEYLGILYYLWKGWV